MQTLFPQSTELLSRSHYPVVIVGGGQAGISTSHFLKKLGVDHIIFEKKRVAYSWAVERWDAFCLVTPNWQCRLPDFPYAGEDPRGFMLKDEIVDYVEAFAKKVAPPIVEGVSVQQVSRTLDGKFEVVTSVGQFSTDHVVVATGGYDIPIVPAYAHSLPKHITQIHSVDYRNPQSLPEGEVLVVGSGQSGVQIMEDLHIAGRKVHLCVGPAPRAPRVYRGREVTEWLMEMGYYNTTVETHPLGVKARESTNHYFSGRDGGHEIDLRKFANLGVRLYGSMNNIKGSTLEFLPDLTKNLDDADSVYVSIRNDIDKYIAKAGIDIPIEAPFEKVWVSESDPLSVDCDSAGITTIIWAIGFRPDYSWIHLPAFDGRGRPEFERGVSPVNGLYFLGLPWLHTWGSGRFLGIAEDAEYLAEVMAQRLAEAGATASPATLAAA